MAAGDPRYLCGRGQAMCKMAEMTNWAFLRAESLSYGGIVCMYVPTATGLRLLKHQHNERKKLGEVQVCQDGGGRTACQRRLDGSLLCRGDVGCRLRRHK